MNLLLILSTGGILSKLYYRFSHHHLLRVLYLHILRKDKDAFVLKGGKVSLSHLALLFIRGHLTKETILKKPKLKKAY